MGGKGKRETRSLEFLPQTIQEKGQAVFAWPFLYTFIGTDCAGMWEKHLRHRRAVYPKN